MDQFDFIKTEIFCSSKDTVITMKDKSQTRRSYIYYYNMQIKNMHKQENMLNIISHQGTIS